MVVLDLFLYVKYKMTTISAVITEDGVFCTGDTLVTTSLDGLIKKRFSSAKKVLEATCILHTQYSDLKDIYDGENSKTYNIGFGFAGNVSLIESLKSRINHKVSYGSYGKCLTIKSASLDEICLFYIFVFNQILENHLYTFYENKLKNGLDNSDYNSINTSCILFGFCEIENKHKIYKIFIDKNFKFNKEDITELYNVVTIGDKVDNINRILNEKISKEICQNFKYEDFLVYFNSLIFKFVIDDSYITIGGTITPYHLYKNNIQELILEDPLYKKFKMSGLSVYNSCSQLQMSSYYFFRLNIAFIGICNILEYYKKRDSEIFEFIQFIKENRLVLKEKNKEYEAYFYNKEKKEYEFFEKFPYNDLYYYRLIKHILDITNFLINSFEGDYIELNVLCKLLKYLK